MATDHRGRANPNETIVAVAVRYGLLMAVIVSPARHHNVLHEAHRLGLEDEGPDAQGFITSTGRFVDRREACLIAKRADQIIKKTGPDHILFSEDLW